MKFLRFGGIVNIALGVLAFIGAIALGVIGVFGYLDQYDLIRDLLPANAKGGFDEFLAALNASPAQGIEYAAANGFPQFVTDLLTNNSTPILAMGFGFGIAGYIILVQFILTGTLLSQIDNVDRGNRVKVSRALAIITSILSLLPFAISGILMIIGSFGKQPANRQRRPQNVRSYY